MMYDSTEADVGNGIIFDIKRNVKSINTDIHTSHKKYEFHDENLSDSESIRVEPHIFFIFETPSHPAFGHWVFESAIFLPYFKNFENARVLVNSNPKRDYKQLFFNLFNIDKSQIHSLDNTDEDCVYQNIPGNNICIISRNFTLNDKSENSRNPACLELYKQLLVKFKNQIIDNIVDYNNKSIEHLFLPRNSEQNYKWNDRILDYTAIKKLLCDKQYTLYNTLETIDFRQQIKVVSSAKNIYLDYGSNFLVNGFFSKGSNIYCINIIQHQLTYPFLLILYTMIKQENDVVFI